MSKKAIPRPVSRVPETRTQTHQPPPHAPGRPLHLLSGYVPRATVLGTCVACCGHLDPPPEPSTLWPSSRNHAHSSRSHATRAHAPAYVHARHAPPIARPCALARVPVRAPLRPFPSSRSPRMPRTSHARSATLICKIDIDKYIDTATRPVVK